MIILSLPQGVQGRYGHVIPLTPLVLNSIFVYTQYSTDDYSNCALAYTCIVAYRSRYCLHRYKKPDALIDTKQEAISYRSISPRDHMTPYAGSV